MQSIYIMSTTDYSGKSLLALGIGLKLREFGKRIGYFKPFGRLATTVDGAVVDKDACVLKGVLGLDEPLQEICPVVLTRDLLVDGLKGESPGLMDKVKKAFRKISRNKDVVIIGGAGNMFDGLFLGIGGMELSECLEARVILIDSRDFLKDETFVDTIMVAKGILGDRLLGTVVNNISRESRDFILEFVSPFLERKGIKVLGVIPHDDLLGSVAVSELTRSLSGKILCAEQAADELVESFQIGAMDAHTAQKHLRKIKNNALITGGQRTEMIMAALDTPTKCMILTGGHIPSQQVISAADRAGVPLISVRMNTRQATETVERIMGRVRLGEQQKIRRARELLDTWFNYDVLFKELGIG
ncbi:MAG: phosphotransacetylase family protein [bacterium]